MFRSTSGSSDLPAEVPTTGNDDTIGESTPQCSEAQLGLFGSRKGLLNGHSVHMRIQYRIAIAGWLARNKKVCIGIGICLFIVAVVVFGVTRMHSSEEGTCWLIVRSKLSSPHAKRAGPKGLRAESARAVTGRRCPHSGVG